MSEQEPKTPKEPIDTSLLNRLDIRRPNDPSGELHPVVETPINPQDKHKDIDGF